MEKNRLVIKRKAKGFSQSAIAEKLCMDMYQAIIAERKDK